MRRATDITTHPLRAQGVGRTKMNLLAALGQRKIAVIVTASIALVAVIMAVPRLRWRAQVTALHFAGKIPDIEFSELVAYMMPGSEQGLERLVITRSPYAVIANFKTSPADIESGHKLFSSHCANCHG